MEEQEQQHAQHVRSTARRDQLTLYQTLAQKQWRESKVFEVNASTKEDEKTIKFFGNFPYPYMNGLLHLGHAFSLSKLEFASAYHRLKGENVLFPFGFHCTGMPIKACADKIEKEIKTYGNPPIFPSIETADAEAVEAEKKKGAEEKEFKDPTKFAAKKSKAAAKTGKQATQWGIMQASGIADEEIPSFADSMHWLEYFPPLAKRDVALLGCQVDWRRSFITTDVNPFYDSFVRWQFNTLKKLGKIVKAKRYAVYSPIDKQPCADHDRASGEGVGPQEYLLIKMHVLEENFETLECLKPLKGKEVFLAAATLRPETMYGQTNCWILPEGEYGAYELKSKEVFVMAERAALNLSYQEQFEEEGKPKLLCTMKGSELMGCSVKAPNAVLEKIYVLPMFTISMTKGTGVVTSVPSDSPDDFMALSDLKSKEALRAKFNVKDEWVVPFEVIPIINIPGYGDASAPAVCEELKIKSQNDRQKLDEAKHRTYLKGFTDGVMIVGEYKGKPVKEVKPIIKQEMVEANTGLIYSEPEKMVMSRSGGECVVALTDQWYLEYGEENWKDVTEKCLNQMNTYHEESKKNFEHTLGWLRQWACSRSFGLGTKVPWDDQFLIESLSDSTIYMAYYTVAHLFQGDYDMYGKKFGSVEPSKLTDAVWDCIFLGAEKPSESEFPRDVLDKAIAEFNYWYPFDLRVSGKDLIQNHLTFSMYSHTAIWPEGQENRWPRAFRCNGHLLLNGDKMSKSTGNFKTLGQAIEEFGADAVRFALADAGDTVEDANFSDETANAAILRLTKECDWMESMMNESSDERKKLRIKGDDDKSGDDFADRAFENSINFAIEETQKYYENMMFREALRTGFYNLQAARDEYRQAVGEKEMRLDLIEFFVEVQTLLLTPVCPHTCEHVWKNVLKKKSKHVVNAGFPSKSKDVDVALMKANAHVNKEISNWRKMIAKVQAPPKKGKATVKTTVTDMKIYVAKEFIGWRSQCLQIMKELHSRSKLDSKEVMDALKNATELLQEVADGNFKGAIKVMMPFIKFKMDEVNALAEDGASALENTTVFDEFRVFEETSDYVCKSLGLNSVKVFYTTTTSSDKDDDSKDDEKVKKAKSESTPGAPSVAFGTLEEALENM